MKSRIYKLSFASVYPLYVAKLTKKGRTTAELQEVLTWLTGYSQKDIEKLLVSRASLEEFFSKAPTPNPLRTKITGVICGVRIETIEDPLMREVRYLDKLVDELAKGRPMEKVLRHT